MKLIKLIILILVILFSTNLYATELKSSGRILDSVNTTVSNIGVDGVYTGTWTASTEFSSVLVQIITDQDSAEHGLEIQTRYSANPTAIHTHFYTVYASSAGVHFEEALSGDEYRIIYTNGSVATTIFSLTTTPGRTSAGIHMHPADHIFKENHPVQLGRSIIAGIRKDGTSANVLISDHNALYTHYSAHAKPDTSVHMVRLTGITDTLTVASVKGDNIITVSNGAQWAEGNKIKISDASNNEYDMLKIITIGVPTANDLTLDRQLDVGHDIGISVIGVAQNMAVDGNATPVTFSYTPYTGKAVHVHSIHVTIESSAEPSLGLFGGQSALTNGVHFRIKRTVGRDSTYWIPFRTMNSMVLSGFTFTPYPKAGTWFSNLTIDLTADSNTVISIDEAAGESFEVIIQDNNNDGNIAMEVKLSIHEVD